MSNKITEYVKDIIGTESRIHNIKPDAMVISSLQEKSSRKIALIDHEVYELYGLTEEEINTVEEQTSDKLTISSILEDVPPMAPTNELTIS